MSDVTVSFDVNKTLGSRQKLFREMQVALDVQVVKDSNEFCPMDEGTLKSSAMTYTDFGSGVVEWNTPYAKEQYYSKPNKSKDANPNARMKWFEYAKALYKTDWLKLMQGKL